MKKIRTLKLDDTVGQFGEFPERMLIYNDLYDINTLELASEDENSFNITNDNDAAMYVGTKALDNNNSRELGGGIIAPTFEGRGSNRGRSGRFSWNCNWQEPVNMPIYEWVGGDFYYVYMHSGTNSNDAGIHQYSKNGTKYYSRFSGNNWGSQTWTIQADIDKGRFIMIAPHNYHRRVHIYEFTIALGALQQTYSTYYENYYYLHQGNVLVNNEDHVISAYHAQEGDRMHIRKYVKDTHAFTSFQYNHPTNTDNTSGIIPVRRRDDGTIVNVSERTTWLVTNFSKGIDTTLGVREYYMTYHILPGSNNYAPFVATYVDSEGVTQDVNMIRGIQSNESNRARYFGLYKVTVDYNANEFYMDVIDIDWSSYPEANMWDITDTASREESYEKNVHMDMDNGHGSIYNNTEIFTIDNVDYIIAISIAGNADGYACNKMTAMVFTYDSDTNTAILVGKPHISVYWHENRGVHYYVKKMDDTNQDWMVTVENRSHTGHQEISRLQWNPIDGFIEFSISDYWNRRSLYIDKLNRVWGLDYDGMLWVGDINNELKYDISLQNQEKFKWDGVNDIIEVINIRVRDLLGKLQPLINISVKIIAANNNVVFIDNTNETIITTNDIGLASIDIKMIGDGDFEIVVDKEQVV